MKAKPEANSADGQARRLEGEYEGAAALLSQRDWAQRSHATLGENSWSPSKSSPNGNASGTIFVAKLSLQRASRLTLDGR